MSAATAARKPAARLPRPAARYWKGKAPKGAGEVSSDESDYDETAGVHVPEEEGDVLIQDVTGEDEEDERRLDMQAQRKLKTTKGINVALRDVNISKEGKVIVSGKEESGRTQAELEEEEEGEEEEEAKPDEESSEYETESEEESEEEKPKLQFRPVFVPKRARVTVAEKEAMAEHTEDAIRKKEAEAEERRRESHNMVAESIRRELLEKEKEAEVPDVDDTDGLDPAGEFEAWRLRELARIKRDKEAALARELEREEIERRRALPEEQRLKEDLERAEKTRKEKPKGQQKFLQKYWHKGAFHQDEEVLKKHDYTEATESTIDVSLLPQVMQVKNFGKRGRTKYTHLLDQDTTAGTGGFGGTAPVKAGGTSIGPGAGAGCFLCGGPHLKKDCPQNKDLPSNRIGTGANASMGGAAGGRQWGARGDRDGDREKGSWRERDRDNGGDGKDRRRSRERSAERRGNSHRGGEKDRYGRQNRYDGRDGRDRERDHYDGRDRDRDRRRRSYSRSPVRRERWRDRDEPRQDRRRRSRSVDEVHDAKRRRMD
ncbi:hypothetical protein DAEQUDRAFT_766281 [Daedalea quercina L-15889]|uniref:Micro-fibrillar-associated protein 1 C-terminal domain-containing protein n=1 Tax=Daedalea quercina L-15889 TaxID=1314783 RepID=A0A165PPG6_9APHY|nr:hypothetical protein DAEQUDRAFT_766281 [Daedalea quercina L-15889]